MKPSLIRALQIVFRHRWTIVTFLAATVAVVTTASYVLPTVYGASAKLLVIPGNEQLPIFTLSSTVADRAAAPTPQTENILSEMELLQSRPILERVVDTVGLDRRETLDFGGPSRPSRLAEEWRRFAATLKNSLIELGLITAIGKRDQAIADLRNRLKVKPIRSSNVFTIHYADSHPQLAAAVINTLAQEYLAYRRDVYKPTGVVEHFRERLEQQAAELKAAKERLRTYEAKFDITNLEIEIEGTLRLHEDAKRSGAFNQQLDQYARRLATLRAAAPGIKDLRSAVDANQTLYERYAQKYDEVSSNAELTDAKFANVRLIEPASIDWDPIFPHRLLNVVLAVVMGALGGVFFALVLSYFSSKLNTIEEVEAAGVAALGSVPRLHRRALRQHAGAAERGGAFALIAEQLRGSGDRKGFVITGVAQHVGSSTIAAGLALALAAQSERRILVVDADPRVARQRHLLQSPNPPRPSPFAGEAGNLAEAIRATRYPNVDLLTTRHERPTEFDVDLLRRMLDEAARHYDFVVVDTPPLFVSAVAFSLTKGMTGWGIILVVEAGRSSMQIARRAAELLDRQRIPLFGAVLNKRENSLPNSLYRRV